jgi:hypothetical protein
MKLGRELAFMGIGAMVALIAWCIAATTLGPAPVSRLIGSVCQQIGRDAHASCVGVATTSVALIGGAACAFVAMIGMRVWGRLKMKARPDR